MSKRGRKYISEERYGHYLAAKDSFTRREIRREMYLNYLSSDAWRKKRAEVRKRAGDVCEECNYNDGLDVHHLTYQRLFAESLGDLVLLCRACHMKHHELRGTKYGHVGGWYREVTWTPNTSTAKIEDAKKETKPSTKDDGQLSLF